MKTSQAIKRAGSVILLARLLGITHQAIYKWGDEVPSSSEARLRFMRPEWFRKRADRATS